MTSSSSIDALPPRLVLQCQYHHGHATEWIWQWPEAGENFCFSDVLNGLVDVDHDYLGQIAEIRLQSEGAAFQRIWWISNHSRALMCVVNGSPLPYGQQMRLNEGDEVEVGVTGFVVLLSLPDLALSNIEPTFGASFVESPSSQQGGASDFDLTKLAPTQEENGFAESGLEMFSGWVDTPDSIEPVLLKGELGSSQQSSALETTPISVEEKKESAATGVAWEKDSDFEISEDELMVSLHRQYLEVLHNPGHLDDEHLWVRIDRGVKHDIVDPMQVLMSQAGSHHGVSDLLGQVQGIDEVITRIDGLGETDILAPAPFPNVMQLFAPESMLREEQPPSLLRPAQVPSLTLREHHVVSIDSGMNVAWRNKTSKSS
ncbi:TagK domain-containing protein [Uliginosibacterium gangwonense]|uniref:TagK domain-containing protein n=1 Tax=Uliginosibacterium gangwonense TaxID=392736 RepID=UPI000377BF83|nr:TagK domain-containing protein [Uliginosibacterium gangwonense]